jgi:hypothetical protein
MKIRKPVIKMAEPLGLCPLYDHLCNDLNKSINPFYSSKTDSLRHLPTRIHLSRRSSGCLRSFPVLLSSILASRSAIGSLLFTWRIAGPLFDGDGLRHSKKACLLSIINFSRKFRYKSTSYTARRSV